MYVCLRLCLRISVLDVLIIIICSVSILAYYVAVSVFFSLLFIFVVFIVLLLVYCFLVDLDFRTALIWELLLLLLPQSWPR